MNIIEYDDKYIEDVKDLLVELEEYIVSIDKDNLDIVSSDYRDKMFEYDLSNSDICYIAVDNNKVIGLIIGKIRKYDEVDYLDYKCPKMGIITELIVTSKVRSKGIGKLLISKIHEYFKDKDCEYVIVDVFNYNDNGIKFYLNNGYHTRMITMINKIDI